MIDRLMEAMRQEAMRAMRSIAEPRFGIITSFDPVTHRAKARMMPYSEANGDFPETDWMPIATPLVGSGWGIYSSPAVGEQVFIVHQEHDVGAGVIVGRVNSRLNPPAAVPSCEIWVVHKSGSFMKLLNTSEIQIVHKSGSIFQLQEDGTVVIQHNGGASMTLGDDGKVQVVGDVVITGNLNVTEQITDFRGSVDGLRNHYNSHTHIDSRGDVASVPLQQDP